MDMDTIIDRPPSFAQNFCSFLASYRGGADRFADMSRYLPSLRKMGKFYEGASFRMVIGESESPLFDSLLLADDCLVFFLQGSFYEKPDKRAIETTFKVTSIRDATDIILKQLNGSYNGFCIDMTQDTVHLFTDYFGFERIYYRRDEESVWISSSIWPLANLSGNHSINRESLTDIWLLGYPLGQKTLLDSVSIVQPGALLSICLTTGTVEKRIDFVTERDLAGDNRSYKRRFFDITRKHFDYVNDNIKPTSWVTTLTGGNDTRVVLNALCRYGIDPTCLTGYCSERERDFRLAKKIAETIGKRFQGINYNQAFEALKEFLFILDDGFLDGFWMANLGIHAQELGDVVYYGFSGDLLSGAIPFRPHTMNIEEIAHTVFASFFEYAIAPDTVLALTDMNFEQYFAGYYATFSLYEDFENYETYFLQRKNERNFRRIGSFASGAKIGSTPVFLFHDRRIITYYKSLRKDLLHNQQLHCSLSSYKNFRLGLISCSSFPVPSFLTPLFSSFFPATLTEKIKKLLLSDRIAVCFSSKAEFMQFLTKELCVNVDEMCDYINIDNFFHKIKGGKISSGSLRCLFRRINNVLYFVRFMKERNYGNYLFRGKFSDYQHVDLLKK